MKYSARNIINTAINVNSQPYHDSILKMFQEITSTLHFELLVK